MSWIWRIIASLFAFLLASATAFAERFVGEAAARVWRLLGDGFVVVAVAMGVILLISGMVAFADSARKGAPGR